jgi:hypothetical protein
VPLHQLRPRTVTIVERYHCTVSLSIQRRAQHLIGPLEGHARIGPRHPVRSTAVQYADDSGPAGSTAGSCSDCSTFADAVLTDCPPLAGSPAATVDSTVAALSF